eukprot:jgi/Ulvmu1/9904/UM057_0061.1
MPFNNAGGSIRSGLFVLVAGWICHRFAKAWSSRRATSEKQTTHVLGAPGRPAGRLNSAALAFLISHQPFPCVILDLRDCEQSETLLHGVAVKLGSDAVQMTLTDDAKWLTCCKGGGRPSPHHALVFVSETKAKLHAATAAASLHGFYNCFTVMAKRPLELPQQEPPEPRLISSDALAHLMNIRGASGDAKLPVFVDVRRHDERTLFGCINGSVHIPAEDIALALQSSNDMFEQIARTPAWAKEDAVVFHSRGTCRAQWAAIIAAQQGYVNVLVLSGGTNEWQFQRSVLRYAHYEFGDPIPAAIAPVVRSVNFDEAAEDLLILGLL